MSTLQALPRARRKDTSLEQSSPELREVLDAVTFQRMIAIERRRTERSKEPFLLMLLDSGKHIDSKANKASLERMARVLLQTSRETDIVGWYKDGKSIGVMFTGLDAGDKNAILTTFMLRITSAFEKKLILPHLSQVSISFHMYPDDWDHGTSGLPSNPAFYTDLELPGQQRRSLLLVKRVIDIVGSSLALLAASPMFLGIALLVKLTSKGPIFFRQQRVGQYGKCFHMLKFRSMYANNDSSVHQKFVMELINNQTVGKASETEPAPVFKIKNDKRITPIGKFLRASSLDELPQFLNVLMGEMSLVGPRPPILYEVEAYQPWHRRRLLEAKPGITGLWQVIGRSRVKFDDMVRLDLRYTTSWSIWLDLRILMRTPMAVLRGSGAH